MSAKSKGFFRRPQSIGERRHSDGLFADQRDESDDAPPVSFRDRRSTSKLPDEREDIYPAAQKDRSRGKPTLSKVRKRKAAERWANPDLKP